MAKASETATGPARYEVTITGVTPLLMHWDNPEWQDEITAYRAESKSDQIKGDDRCPAHTWKGSVYNDGKTVCLPTDNFRSCLTAAGKKISKPKAMGKGSFKVEAAAAILFDDLYLPLLVNGKTIPFAAIEEIKGTFPKHVEAAEKLGFELFVKRATIGSSKHVRVRPQFRHWACAGEIVIVSELLTEEWLRKIFDIAGQYCGMGDWRPGSPKSPGPFGKFKAELKKI